MNPSTPNEQTRLWIGGMVAACLLFVGLVVFPTHDRIDRTTKSLASRQRELEQVRRLAGQLTSLPKTGTVASAESPVQTLDRCLASLNLTDRVSNRRPFGPQGQGVEIKLDDVPGTSVSQLLTALHQGGVNPSAVELHDVKAQGVWSIRLTLGSSGEGS